MLSFAASISVAVLLFGVVLWVTAYMSYDGEQTARAERSAEMIAPQTETRYSAPQTENAAPVAAPPARDDVPYMTDREALEDAIDVYLDPASSASERSDARNRGCWMLKSGVMGARDAAVDRKMVCEVVDAEEEGEKICWEVQSLVTPESAASSRYNMLLQCG
nr:hypothetical protein TetV2_00521 [Oceanusvirus sp.]